MCMHMGVLCCSTHTHSQYLVHVAYVNSACTLNFICMLHLSPLPSYGTGLSNHVCLQFEAAWSKGEIPSNTEDILRSRGVYSVGDPRLENQTDDAQAHAQGKVMRG